MALPEDSELLGASVDQLEIKGAGAQVVINLKDGTRRNLAANASSEIARDRIYLALEDIQGTHDATVLNVYINLPKSSDQGDRSNQLAGSVGLYGLRRASRQQREDGGRGLTSILDITQKLNEPPVTKSTFEDTIRVDIVPHPPLPDAAVIVGRISIFRQRD